MQELYRSKIEPYLGYHGTGEAPADYDEYWARAKAELAAASLEYELEETSFKAKSCEAWNLYFTGVGGARVHCQFLKPRNVSGKMPAIVLFHGYWSNSGDWSQKLRYVAEGFCVLAMDVRGQGGESSDCGVYDCGNTQSGHIIRGLECENPDKMFYRNVFLDAGQCARILMSMEFVDETNVFACGGSQGGALTLACASLNPNLKGAVAIYPYLCDFQGVYKRGLEGSGFEELTWYFRQRDPMHRKEEFFFNRLGYIDTKNRVRDIQCDILWMIGLSDPICPPYAQMAAYNNLTCPKQMICFPEYGHEGLLYGDDEIQAYLMRRLAE